MSDREIVADPLKLRLRFGDGDPETFFYRREFLNSDSENLGEKGVSIHEGGGTRIQRQMRFLRCADGIPEGGRPSVVREFGCDVDWLENLGSGLPFLQSGQFRLGMRTLGCVRPRDSALTLGLANHFEKCEHRLAFCHFCSAYFAAVTGVEKPVGILDRAQVSTRRISNGRVLGADTNAGSCKRIRIEDPILLTVASKKIRMSDFGLAKKVCLEERRYCNENIADCK